MADNIVPEQPITTFSKEKWFGGRFKEFNPESEEQVRYWGPDPSPRMEWPLTGDDFKTAVNLRTGEVLRKDQDGK